MHHLDATENIQGWSIIMSQETSQEYVQHVTSIVCWGIEIANIAYTPMYIICFGTPPRHPNFVLTVKKTARKNILSQIPSELHYSIPNTYIIIHI